MNRLLVFLACAALFWMACGDRNAILDDAPSAEAITPTSQIEKIDVMPDALTLGVRTYHFVGLDNGMATYRIESDDTVLDQAQFDLDFQALQQRVLRTSMTFQNEAVYSTLWDVEQQTMEYSNPKTTMKIDLNHIENASTNETSSDDEWAVQAFSIVLNNIYTSWLADGLIPDILKTLESNYSIQSSEKSYNVQAYGVGYGIGAACSNAHSNASDACSNQYCIGCISQSACSCHSVGLVSVCSVIGEACDCYGNGFGCD